MSYFDFPRMNFTGSVTINVGTVNNDDYGAVGVTIATGPGAGQILRLSDSVNVQALTYGMNDADFITWCNTPLAVTNNGAQTPVLPGEWNYFGDMTVTFNNVNVVGVNPLNGSLVTTGNPLIGTNLSFNNDAGRSTALICDVNPEDVPSSQIFADVMALRDSQGNNLFSGAPSKAVTRWINFFRNANLTASAGASGVFQHVVPISNFNDPGVQSVLTNLGMNVNSLPANLAGFVVRYSIYQTIPNISQQNPEYSNIDAFNAALVSLYATPYPNNLNPGIGTVSGTIGLWFEGEMKSITMGRYLIPPAPTGVAAPPPVPQNIPMQMFPIGNATTPNNFNNGNVNGISNFQLGATVINVYPSSGRITLDVTNTFPEFYKSPGINPKFPFTQYNNADGIVLGYIPSTGENVTLIASLDYANTALYINGGGLLDITGISSSDMLAIQAGTLVIAFTNAGTIGTVLLKECDYMIASDQAAVYAEQNQTTNSYRNDAPQTVNCCVNVYHKGSPITNNVSLIVQEAQTTPNVPGADQLTGRTQTVTITPNTNNTVPLTFTSTNRGNLLYRVAIADSAIATTMPMPCNQIYSYAYLNLATDFYINLRVLPTDDFSLYLNAQGVSNGTPIPWAFLYSNVLQYYNLIFPAMGLHVPFVESVWQDMAAKIYERADISYWATTSAMPRTRDLSQTRRQLLQAWCKQYMPA